MPTDKPLTPEERLGAIRFGRFSKLKGQVRDTAKEKWKVVDKAEELGVFDRAAELFKRTKDKLFGGEVLKKAAGG